MERGHFWWRGPPGQGLSGEGDNSELAGWPGHWTEGRMQMGREGLQGKLRSPDGRQPGNRSLSLTFLLVINTVK